MYTLRAAYYEYLLCKELDKAGCHVTMRAVKLNKLFVEATHHV